MPPSPVLLSELQAAVDRANQAIRGFWLRIPEGVLPTPEQWLLHEGLVAEWNAALVARDAGAREGEDEPAPALTAA